MESEDVLSRLLGDRAASADNTTIALILLVRIGNGIPIKATVLVELGVLVVDDSGDEVGRDVLEGCPVVLYLQMATLLVCLDMALEHQRRERYGDEPEEQDEDDAAKQEGQQEVGEDTAKARHLGRIFNYLRQLLSILMSIIVNSRRVFCFCPKECSSCISGQNKIRMKKLTQGNQRLANRFAIFVDEGAEAVGPFAKRSEESVLGLSCDIIEARRREDTITLVHKAFLAIVVGIDIAVGLFPDLVALRVLATSVVGELGDGLVDDLVDEFAVVGEEVLDAVVLGGDESLRPIDIDRLVGADKDGVEGVVIDDAFLVEAGVVEALLVLVFDHGIDRRQHPLRCGVDESDLVVIDIDDEFVAVVE